MPSPASAAGAHPARRHPPARPTRTSSPTPGRYSCTGAAMRLVDVGAAALSEIFLHGCGDETSALTTRARFTSSRPPPLPRPVPRRLSGRRGLVRAGPGFVMRAQRDTVRPTSRRASPARRNPPQPDPCEPTWRNASPGDITESTPQGPGPPWRRGRAGPGRRSPPGRAIPRGTGVRTRPGLGGGRAGTREHREERGPVLHVPGEGPPGGGRRAVSPRRWRAPAPGGRGGAPAGPGPWRSGRSRAG